MGPPFSEQVHDDAACIIDVSGDLLRDAVLHKRLYFLCLGEEFPHSATGTAPSLLLMAWQELAWQNAVESCVAATFST